MAGVQLIGKGAVLETFDDMELEDFAFFQGKELIVAGAGRDELEKWCDRFTASGSGATVKFRLYDAVNEGDRVRTASDYVCSFEVKFSDPYQGAGIMGGWGNQFMARIEKLEKKMDGTGDKEETVMDRIGDAVMGMLEEPEKLGQFLGAIRGFMSGTPVAAIGNVQEHPGRIITPDESHRVDRLAKALDDLEKADPKIVDHLEKLATIGRTQPATFKTLLGMLETF